MVDISEKIKIIKTDDGSIGLYNMELDEIYHSKSGAKKEAIEKFINPVLDSGIVAKNARILDICYGIGYNTKCAVERIPNIEYIDCVEIDKNLVFESYKFDFSPEINRIIENNLKNPEFINFYTEDIREFIQKTKNKYNIIFHDGFAPYKQPELWSEELILKIAQKLEYNGIYCTYNHSKPVLNALYKAGLTLGYTVIRGKIEGTVASYNKDLVKNKLNSYELGMLNTKSAITYKDSFLNFSSNEIIKNRESECKNSKILTLSSYKKLYKSDSTASLISEEL